MYAVESQNLPHSVTVQLNVWWNSAYRKIFGYNKWESVKEVICWLGRLNVHHLIMLRRLLFVKRVNMSSNSDVLKVIHKYVTGPEAKM